MVKPKNTALIPEPVLELQRQLAPWRALRPRSTAVLAIAFSSQLWRALHNGEAQAMLVTKRGPAEQIDARYSGKCISRARHPFWRREPPRRSAPFSHGNTERCSTRVSSDLSDSSGVARGANTRRG